MSEMRPSAEGLRELPLAGASLLLDEHVWSAAQADALFTALHTEIPWQTLRLRIFGREIAARRLACWIGDADAVYTYSRTRFEPQPWTPTTTRLRRELHARLGIDFNSVLANLYRDGRDSMGWHSDDEPELGNEPVIASLSFGAVRSFRLRTRSVPRRSLTLELASGSLLLIAGRTQALYEHALPRRMRVSEPRINLTFRRIVVQPNRAP